MGSPTLIGTQTQELALADGVSSIITNVGSNPVYLGSYDGISDTNYEYLLNAGATIEWNGYTRVYAIAGPNAPSAIQIFKNSTFMFDGYATGKAVSEQAYRTLEADVYQVTPDDGSLAQYITIALQVPRGTKTLELGILPDSNFAVANAFAFYDYNILFYDTPSMKAFNSALVEQGQPTHPFYPSIGNATAFRIRGNGPTSGYQLAQVDMKIPATGPWVSIQISRANTDGSKLLAVDVDTVLAYTVFSNKDIRFPYVYQDFLNAELLPQVNTQTLVVPSWYSRDQYDFTLVNFTGGSLPIPYRFGWNVEILYKISHTLAGSVAPFIGPIYEQSDGVVTLVRIDTPFIMPLTTNDNFGKNNFIHPPAPVALNLNAGTGNGTFNGTISVRYSRYYG